MSPVRRWPWSKHALYDNKSAHHISRKTCCQRTKHLSLVPVPSPALQCSFSSESLYVPISQGEQPTTYKTPLIYIRLSLGPRMRLSHKAAAVCFATSRKTMCSSALNQPPEKQLGGRDGSKTRLLTSPVLALPSRTPLLYTFSLFTVNCTDNGRLG